MLIILSNIIIISLIGHVLGDYYFQSNKMLRNEYKKFSQLILHLVKYSFPFIIFLLFTEVTSKLVLYFILINLSHYLIDLIKFLVNRTIFYENNNEKYIQIEWFIYLLDQTLHIIAIFIISIFFFDYGLSIEIKPIIRHVFMRINLDAIVVLRWILLLLCIYKPSNITFIRLFSQYKPDDTNASLNNELIKCKVNNKSTGAIIGFLERLLIVIFISLNQYSAVGLILTAKSIARYERISKDQEFAEYYLIGTLTSVLLSILLYLAIHP